MSLEFSGYIELPAHNGRGGFDHAAVYQRTTRLYVAHTANDALDVIDCARDVYLHSIPNLTGVAGALVSDARGLVLTSNRGEDTIGIFSPGDETSLRKVTVGIRPNGLAFDPARNLALAANVGDPAQPDSYTLSLVDVERCERVAEIAGAGRTRWTVFDPQADVFYVNIAAPAQIVVIYAQDPTRIARLYSVPAVGPHGLDLDSARRRLYCACDDARLLVLDADSGETIDGAELSGAPDVIFFNALLSHLYVAIGVPGVIDIFDTTTLERIQVMPTERGAHTIAFDAARNKVFAFLPESHRAAVYVDAP